MNDTHLTDTQMNDMTLIRTQIQTGLPRLTLERIDQMASLACAQKQDCHAVPFYRAWADKWSNPQAVISRRIAYGFGTLALTTACLAFIVSAPVTPVMTGAQDGVSLASSEEISDLMLYDLLVDLT